MGYLLINEVHSYNPMISLITDSFAICLFVLTRKFSVIEVSPQSNFLNSQRRDR